MLTRTGGLKVKPNFSIANAPQPNVIVVPAQRATVDNGRIATAGGLTSSIDMALHIVARYFGETTAMTTAKYMEYSSEAWKS